MLIQKYSFLPLLKKTGLPFIISDDTPSFCFLVDTGSTHNILFSFVYDEFPNKFIPLKTEVTISGIEGNEKKGAQMIGSISLLGKSFQVPFTIIKDLPSIQLIKEETGVQVHGILGLDFLIKSMCIINFKELTIEI